MDTDTAELEGEGEARGPLEEIERGLRVLLMVLYLADLCVCVDLLTNGAPRRLLAARWRKVVEARRRRHEWNRARCTMLFEALTILEEEGGG